MSDSMTPDPHDRFFKGKAFEALEALVRSGADDLTYLRTALTYLFMVSGFQVVSSAPVFGGCVRGSGADARRFFLVCDAH